MPLINTVIFTDQSQIDAINASLSQGLSIIGHVNSSTGDLVYWKTSLDAILNANHGLSQPQVDELNALPQSQIFIPSEEEMMGLNLAPMGQFMFVLEGSSSASEKFMTVATKMAIPSNLTPAVLPANLHIVSMFWMNEVDNANVDINVYLNGSLHYTWNLTNTRWAVINADDEFSPLMSLPERGLLSAGITTASGTSAKDGYLYIVFRLVGETTPGEFVSPTL